MSLVVRLLVCAALLLPGASTAANVLAGRAEVIDGDTIDIQGERIRLLDVDAPEIDQVCERLDGTEWPCGQQAALKLAEWIGGRVVSCETNRKNPNKQWLAHCVSGGEDLARWLASRGWAVPYRECECETIRGASEGAKELQRGIWAGSFVMPWDWRNEH